MALIERIDEESIEFMECYCNPLCLAETTFSTLDNLVAFDENLAEIRLGQLPMLSYEYMIEENYPGLTQKQNFKHKENSGNVFAFGGRRFGKTLLVEQVDIMLSMLWLDGEHVGFSSLDALHIRGILEKIIQVLRTHEFYKLLEAQINRSPNYRISLKSGYLLESINMNVAGATPGVAFYQKHIHRLYLEEASLEPEEVYNKRQDSISEDGCVYRVAGMTDFTKYSPAGRTFYDLTKKNQVCNLPQYVNPKWGEAEKIKAIQDYGGEQSGAYRVFVKGEVVDEGIAVFDMERVRKQYQYDKQVKTFEINKDNFNQYKDILIIERPKNAKVVYLCGDIGETAPTDIVIIIQVNDKYYYTYEIVAYRLDDKQQSILFEYLANLLQAEVISIDCTEGTGRAIFRNMSEKFGAEKMCFVGFNEKIGVDYERDEKNRVVFEFGKPKLKEEYVSEWSIKRLKHLFYNGMLFVPSDHKLDKQLNSVISKTSGQRVAYTVVCEEDHLLSAFRCFSVAEYKRTGVIFNPINTKKHSKCGV